MMGTAFGRSSLGLWVETYCFALLITSRVMEGLTLEERRILIGNFYNENKDKGKSYTVHHFRRMNVPKRTIYRIIKRVEKDIPLTHRPGAGRPAIKMPKRRIKGLIKRVKGRTDVFQRKEGLRFGITQPYVTKILKEYGIRYYKRQFEAKNLMKTKNWDKRNEFWNYRKLNFRTEDSLRDCYGRRVILSIDWT